MSDQLPLTWHPMSRTSDPESSHAAARRMRRSGKAQSQRDAVLAAVKRWPLSTSKEIAQLAGLERHIPGRRLSELLREKKVERVGGSAGEYRWTAR